MSRPSRILHLADWGGGGGRRKLRTSALQQGGGVEASAQKGGGGGVSRLQPRGCEPARAPVLELLKVVVCGSEGH